MEEKSLLERWKTIKKKEEKDNPFGKFVIDEGEFVTITPGVQQLKVEELYEEEKVCLHGVRPSRKHRQGEELRPQRAERERDHFGTPRQLHVAP